MISRAALAAVSAAILGYEVLLVRLFAIVQWHHFAFMAITVALLGFGIGGTLLSLARPWALKHAHALFVLGALFFALSAPAAFLLCQRLPFNALEVMWEPSQLLYPGAMCLLLALPFTAGASCVGLAFLLCGRATASVYLWNLLGSGAGALAVFAALIHLPPLACLLLVAAAGLVAALLCALQRSGAAGPLAVVATALLLAAGATALPASWTSLGISEFKGLSRALAVEGARLALEVSSPRALLSVVESPTVPFRHAPGLGPRAPSLPPPQLGVFADGGFETAIDLWDGDTASLAYLDHVTDALAYHLREAPRVLALGVGGGHAILQALGHGASLIDAVEVDPDMLRLWGATFAERTGALRERPRVRTHADGARRFLAAHERRWDLIVLPPVSAAAAMAPGLAPDTLMTVEGLRLAYRRLAPGGWLSATVPVDLPPREAPKLAATLRGALEREGVAAPARRFLAIRGMTTVTVLVKRGDVTAADIATARAFAEPRVFDLVFHPGMSAAEANRRNLLARPVFFEAVAALLGPGAEDFIAGHAFDIAPASDDRPYFRDFFRWATFPEWLALGPAAAAAQLDVGQPIVAATLVQAVLLGLVLVLLPLRGARYRRKPGRVTGRYGLFFCALGLAFLFVEIALIGAFELLLGDPLHALAVVLCGFLVFAGLGAGASARAERVLGRGRIPAVRAAALASAVLALAYPGALPPLFEALIALDAPWRIAAALVLIAPLAFVMGMPFPLGLARLARLDPDFVPWAWGLNGCASVAAAAAATLCVMQFGHAAAMLAAVALYLLAALALDRERSGAAAVGPAGLEPATRPL